MSAVAGVEKIATEIDAYIRNGGGGYPAWYCGIAANPRDRLFIDHSVTEKGGSWIYRDAGTDNAARNIEEYFIKKGCKGGGGGGDGGTRYVYAYKITATTRE